MCIIGCMFFCGSIFSSYQRTYYGAIAIRFAESIKSNRCLYPESFSFNNSEFYWSITQFFTLITTTVFSDLSMARMVASLLTIIVAGLAITYCSHVIGGEKSFLIAIILIFVYLQNQKNFILYSLHIQ